MIGFLRRRVFALENIPSLLFFAFWRAGAELEHAAWTAAIASAFVFTILWFRQYAPDTIMLGINLHFIATPNVIQLVYETGNTQLAYSMIEAAGVAVIGTILIAGIVLTAFTSPGFIGSSVLSRGKMQVRSVMLIFWTSIALAWSVAFMGDQLLSVGLPILSIFLMRRLLQRPDIGPSVFLPAIPLLTTRPLDMAGRAIRSTIDAV